MSSNNGESLSKYYDILYLPKDASLQQIENTYQVFKEFKENSKLHNQNSEQEKLLVEHELAFCKILKFKNAEKQFKAENQPQQKNLLIPDGMIPFVMNFGTSQLNSTNSTKLQSNVLQNRLSSVKPRNYFDNRPIPLRSPGTFKQIPLQTPGTFKQIHIPQTNFKRINQFDIEYNEHLVLKEGQTCGEMKIPLDREFLTFIKENQERSNLVVRFNIVSEQEFNQKQFAKEKIAEKASVTKHNVSVTLEEVFEGSKKLVSINRKRFDDQTGEKGVEKASFTIDIKPGAPEGEEILFPVKGDQLADGTFTDLLFCLQTAPHSKFTRDGADLKYFAKVSECQLKNQEEILIPTLDGRTFKVKLDDEVLSGGSKKYFGHGLPYPNDTQIKGNLLVQFQDASEEEAKKETVQDEPKVVAKTPKVAIEKSQQNEQNQVKVNLPKLKSRSKDPDIERNLGITLEEIFTGCTKKLKINRQVLDAEGKEHFFDEIISIDVPPGCKEGHKFRCPNLGDEYPHRIPADIVFTIKYKAHSKFTPKGNDIECTEMIASKEVQLGVEIEIPSLNEPKPIFQLVNKLTNIKDGLKIPNKGLPIDGNLENRGNLIIHFKIVSNTHKVPAKEILCNITLEEMLQNIAKKMTILQIHYDKDGKQISEHLKELNFVVKKGTSTITKFPFTRIGDVKDGFIQGDVIVIVKPEEHKVYKRVGSNLEYTFKVKSSELGKPGQLNVPLLDGTFETIQFEKVSRNLYRKIQRQGLPIAAKIPNSRGDLIVKVEVEPDETKETTSVKKSFIAQNVQKPKLPLEEKETTPFGKIGNLQSPFQHEPIFQNVVVSLEEVLTGAIKQVTIQRKAIDSNGNAFLEDKTFTIDVKPGTMSGQKINYLKEGHCNENDKLPGDVIFTIKDKPNEIFTRKGADIEFIALITKLEAEYGFTRNIPSLELDGSKIPIEVNEKTLPNSIKKIPGHGLPMAANSSSRGNLIVRFKIDEKVLSQSPLQHFNVDVPLEKIAKGGNQKITFQRRITSENGEVAFKDEMFKIPIKVGTTEGTQFTFPKKGDKTLGMKPSDIIFTVRYAPHKEFKAKGVNLEYTCRIYARETQHGAQVQIPTLYGPYFVTVTKEIINGITLEIDNYGLPHKNEISKRGKLIVYFKVVEENKVFNNLFENFFKNFV